MRADDAATGEPDPARVSTYLATVRYLECDQQGVVFNMWYLGYFDEAFGLFLAEGGLPYPELIASGVDVQLVHSEINWTGPLRWGDDAVVEVRLARLGTTSFTLDFAAGNGREQVARGRTIYVAVAVDGGGKVPVPPALAAALGPAPTPA